MQPTEGRRESRRYTLTAIGLHWVMAIMILVAIAMGWYMVDLPFDDTRAWFFRHHKNIGLTVALLLMLRLWWRVRHPAPPLPGDVPSWERTAATISHRTLYVLMALLPVSGFFTTSFTGYPTYYLGIPVDLGSWADENEFFNDIFAAIHTFLAYSLLVLVLIHVAAALRHLVVMRDTIFQRMLPPVGRRK